MNRVRRGGSQGTCGNRAGSLLSWVPGPAEVQPGRARVVPGGPRRRWQRGSISVPQAGARSPPGTPLFSPVELQDACWVGGSFLSLVMGTRERRAGRAAKVPLGDAQRGEDEPEVDAQTRGGLGRTLPKLGFSQVEGPGRHHCAKPGEHHRQERFGDLFPRERPSRVRGRGFLPGQKAAQAKGRVSGARPVPVCPCHLTRLKCSTRHYLS